MKKNSTEIRGLLIRRGLSSVLALVLGLCVLTGCGGSSSEGGAHGSSSKQLSYEDAETELDALLTKVHINEVENPAMDIYTDEVSVADTLADISTFPFTVEGRGDINIEIAAPSEFTGEQPDDWLNVIARRFNDSGAVIDGKSVSVTVRKMDSGEVVTYMTEGGYRPDMYIPSNYALGEMLRSEGIGVDTLADRIAGNTAGMLIKKDVYETFKEKYGEATVSSVLEATLAGLILGGMPGFFDSVTAVCQTDDMGIVAGGNIIRLHDLCRIKHLFPLHIAVALNAGIGRLSFQIAPHKRIHNFPGKICHTVQRVVADPQPVGHPLCVIDLTAAAFGAVPRVPGPQRHTADFIPFFLQQISCRGAVHTARHSYQNSFHQHSPVQIIMTPLS